MIYRIRIELKGRGEFISAPQEEDVNTQEELRKLVEDLIQKVRSGEYYFPLLMDDMRVICVPMSMMNDALVFIEPEEEDYDPVRLHSDEFMHQP